MTHAVRFQHPRYTIRRKFFRFFGDASHPYTDAGEPALHPTLIRFRIREAIRLYADESQDQELLRISTRSIFDFAGAYDVHDSQSDEHVGTLRRSGFRSSLLRASRCVGPRSDTLCSPSTRRTWSSPPRTLSCSHSHRVWMCLCLPTPILVAKLLPASLSM